MTNFIDIDESIVEMLQFVAILHLLDVYWDHPPTVHVVLYCQAKFGCNWCSSFHNMKVTFLDMFLHASLSSDVETVDD